MTLEFLLAILLIRYLRKSLQTGTLFPKWDKIFLAAMIASIALMILEIMVSGSRPVATWLAHAILLGIVYIIFSQKAFSAAKPVMYAVLPYIVISVVSDLVRLITPGFYKEWNNYFETAGLFAIIWLGAMLIITRIQKKALEKEQLKTREIEKEIRITESLKAALEVQVAERTAALTQQKEELQHTLTELKAAQSQLIQSEKMASLGELTAGIAHEIQNPLNFINNFSEVSAELIDEMETELNNGNKEDAFAIAVDVKQNLEKIIHHGKRADAIVKGMLQHSRTTAGQKEPADLNALADEYLRLSYHGLRAKDKTFNAALHTSFDKSIEMINVVPQDIGRVLLNLFNNAFYAVTEKKKTTDLEGFKNLQGLAAYEPTVSVSTKKNNGKLEIKVKDNGNGIPQKIIDKIFQPFFTTKPTGQGTGLGLSLSYDIIKAHGGEIKVETSEAAFTEFIIQLPVNDR